MTGRRYKLERPIFTVILLVASAVIGNDAALEKAAKKEIPEFMRFNIVENDVRNDI